MFSLVEALTMTILMQQKYLLRRKEYPVEKLKKHSGTQTESEPSMVSQVPEGKMDLFVQMLQDLTAKKKAQRLAEESQR